MSATSVAITEETDPFCQSPAESAVMLASAPWRRFGVIGESLSLGIGDPRPGYASLGWADRVADVLRRVDPGLAYLNTAEIGATTEQTLERQFGPMLAFAPDLLHLPCGANDIARRAPDFAAIEATMRRMYEAASSTGALLTTFTLGSAYVIPVFADWQERVRWVNRLTRSLASEYGALVIDMWDHPVNEREDLVSADGIHFAACGQAVMATEFVKRVAVAR